jgi:hypothetical protein
MRPEDAAVVLAARAARLREAPAGMDTSAMLQAAREVAALVRQQATSVGHRVGIRVVSKHNGIRLTVTGPRAAQYQGLVERELAARVPTIQAEIRSQITRRAK